MNEEYIVRPYDSEREVCEEVVKKPKGTSQKARRTQGHGLGMIGDAIKNAGGDVKTIFGHLSDVNLSGSGRRVPALLGFILRLEAA
jgi:hypothetical protein